MSERAHPSARNRPRESILWIEGIGFGALVVFAWLTELLQLPHFFFADSPDFNWRRALLRTVVVLGVWLAVHLATRRLLQRLRHLEEYLKICAWCRKIDHEGTWMSVEEFFGSALATKTSHGVCPACSKTIATAAGTRKPSQPVAEKIPPST